jgi:parallel beta-helix repeat protein
MQPPPRRLPARFAPIALAAALAAIGCGLLALQATPAHASHVRCGDTLTADTTLDGDLVDCPNNGVVIGADGITLDLNGHRIDGDGTEFTDCPKNEICDVGVVNDRHDGVKVKGGSTREFGVGVLVSRARDSRVVDISSSKNVFFGALVLESSRAVIRDSSLSNNIAPEGDGLGLFFGSDHIKIVDNSIQHNPGPGIHVDDSANNLIKGNRLSGNGPAILVEANRNEMRENRISRGGGIVVGPGNRNVIARNHVSRAQESISATGRENLIARNVVVDARGRGISLGVDFADGPDLGGVDNIVRRNEVRGSGGDAFLINHKGSYVLKRNVARGAKDDGFDVESRSTRLTKNRATHNADLGIQAVRGVTNGGGNVGRHNGDRRQCTNIACS